MTGRPQAPSWIESLPRRPLCDVPWLGRSVILSDGRVNFCCYSDAVVGNVNEQPLQEIWRGETMNRIRSELAAQRLPPECRSNSCPIYRGDEHFYLLDRMDGARRLEAARGGDPNAAERARLAACELRVDSDTLRDGERLRVELRLHADGPELVVDVFAAVRLPDGRIVFLPELGETPLPLARWISLGGGSPPLSIDLLAVQIGPAIPRGAYEFCVGLFATGTSPCVAANCLWSARSRLTIEARAG